MLVEQWMSQPVISVQPDNTVLDVCELFETHKIRRVPVTNSSSLLGIISDRDVKSALPSTFEISKGNTIWKHYKKVMATEVMSAPVLTIGVRDNIERAAMIMRENSIGGLPVLAGNKTVGMLTEHDVFEAMLEITGADWDISQLTVYYKGSNGDIKTITDEIRKYPARILSLAISRNTDAARKNKVSLCVHTGFIENIALELKNKYDEVYFNKS